MLKAIIFMCFILSTSVFSKLVSASSVSFKVPQLCLLCKCVPDAINNEFNIQCTDSDAAIKLSRSDAWPNSVKSLTFNHAALIDIPRFTEKNLHTLSLSHNAFTSIPANTIQNLDLKELNLGYNGLSQLRLEDISGNEGLKILHLHHNNFEKFDWKCVRALQHLEQIYLQDNYLNELEGQAEMLQLKVLNVSGNNLAVLPVETCSGLPLLKTLHIADNKLSTIPPCLLQLQTLEELVLDGNPIVKISDGDFFELSSLQYLSLSRMPDLKTLDSAALRGLSSLQNLKVSYNPQLTSLDRTFLSQGKEERIQQEWKLITVDISFNGLTSIPSDLAPWEMLFSLNLQGNPWDCSCSAQWMLDKLLPVLYKKNSSLLMDVRCAEPYRFAGRRFVHWLYHKENTFCTDERPAPQTHLNLVQSANSHGMLIALSVIAGVGVLLIAVAVVLQKRANAQRRDLATKLGRCRNPRNGRVKLANPTSNN